MSLCTLAQTSRDVSSKWNASSTGSTSERDQRQSKLRSSTLSLKHLSRETSHWAIYVLCHQTLQNIIGNLGNVVDCRSCPIRLHCSHCHCVVTARASTFHLHSHMYKDRSPGWEITGIPLSSSSSPAWEARTYRKGWRVVLPGRWTGVFHVESRCCQAERVWCVLCMCTCVWCACVQQRPLWGNMHARGQNTGQRK